MVGAGRRGVVPGGGVRSGGAPGGVVRTAGVVVVGGIEGPEDRLQALLERRRFDLGVDQPVGRAEEARGEAGGGADRFVGRGQLRQAGIVRVVEGVVADLVARVEDRPHQLFPPGDVAPLLEEGRAGAHRVERREDRRGLHGARAVVEGERDDRAPRALGDDVAGARGAADRRGPVAVERAAVAGGRARARHGGASDQGQRQSERGGADQPASAQLKT
jgi:hypothetical protein